MNITHYCVGTVKEQASNRRRPCHAFRTSDGQVYLNCGEPCPWIMRKAGEGYPVWTEEDARDEQEVEHA
jgi:hypothetical protein